MALRIGHISDLHVMEHCRFGPTQAVLNDAVNVFRNEGCDIVAITGDLSGRDAPHAMTDAERLVIATFVRKISAFASVIIIRGNHDAENELSVFTKCSDQNPVYVIENGVQALDYGKVRFICVPWQPIRALKYSVDISELSPEGLQAAALDALHQKITNYIEPGFKHVFLAHLPFESAKIGDFEIRSVRDITLTAGFLDAYPFDAGLLGHIHFRQPTETSCHAWYAGSPYPVDYSESGRKGVTLYELGEPTARRFQYLESWNLVTVDAEWNGQWVKNEVWKLKPEELDNTYVKFRIVAPAGTSMKDIDLGESQFYIMKQGGHLDIARSQIIQQFAKEPKKLPTFITNRSTIIQEVSAVVKSNYFAALPFEGDRVLHLLEQYADGL